MQSPAKLDLYADRSVLFVRTITFFDEDFSGGSFAMKVRPTPDASGLAAVSLATTVSSTAEGVRLIYAGTDTIANHVAALRISEEQAKAAGYSDTDTVTLSVVGIRILGTTMALGSFPADETGDDLELAYDLIITPASGDPDKFVYGKFIVRGTVTY